MLTMTLFSNDEIEKIRDIMTRAKKNVMITFRHSFGPTDLKEKWEELLGILGIHNPCVSWWSGASTMGLLECENPDGINVYGQWVLHDTNNVIGVFEIDDEDITNIRAGYDAQSVTDSAMRAIRIGESGGELE